MECVLLCQRQCMPHSYTISLRVAAQDYTNKTKDSPELKKKMSPTNAKAYNTMRQRLKKHCIVYTAAMEAFRKAPESEEEASEEEEEEEEEASSSGDSDAEGGEDGEGTFEKIRSAKDKKKARDDGDNACLAGLYV